MQGEGSLLIVVPRSRSDGRESLSQLFGAGSNVRVILDRRSGDRRSRAGACDFERRGEDRRRSPDTAAELAAGRWIAAAAVPRLIDFLDADNRAILFLCCEKHVIPCQRCQDTYRLGWVLRGDRGTLSCPRCGDDLTAMAAAHAQACHYWSNRLAPRDLSARVANL